MMGGGNMGNGFGGGGGQGQMNMGNNNTGMNQGGGGVGGHNHNRRNIPTTGIHNLVEIAFPREFIGCLIGEKGERIREIRERLNINFLTNKTEIMLSNGSGSSMAGFRVCR